MGPRIVVLRILQRWSIVMALIVAIVALLWMLTVSLRDVDPDPALTALLGAGLGALGFSLREMIQAISANPSDRDPKDVED